MAHTWHWVPLTVFGFAVLALGGWPMVFWLVFFRVTVGLHATWLVNSATHMWGGRRFDTKDDSKNSWWVAILTFGEGWHNNHHAHPTSARHGLAWYELDLTWIQISLLERFGIAQRVRVVDVEGRRRGESQRRLARKSPQIAAADRKRAQRHKSLCLFLFFLFPIPIFIAIQSP